MASAFLRKVFIALGVVVSLSWTSLADNEIQNRSKYKYGYVISHKGGSTQAHLESRDGNLALGRYYVNLQNGTGQKVTYFADDLGFHTGVSYSSQNGKGSSNTQIAVGQKAVAALGNSDVIQSTATIALAPTLLFGNKILKTAFNTVTPQPGAFPQLSYTPVPGGFFLTHKSVETSNDTTERPSYVSQELPIYEGKYSEGVSQSKANTQTFYPTSENVKNVIKELHIESTTPSIKSYTLLPQQDLFSSSSDEGDRFSQGDHTVKVSSYATGLNDLSFSKQKSIEMTNFADIDAQLISEVQKHAEGIIMKDLQRNQNAKEGEKYSSNAFQPSTVTMQPIIVTNDGETGINTVLPTTPVPETRKFNKNSQSDSINLVKTTGKNSDQTLEDSGYFRVSLSPSLSSSINVSQTPHQSINVESTDRNSDSNNSTVCEFNLCEKDSNQIFSVDLSDVKPKKETEDSGSDVSNGLGTNKIIRTFYPENKAHDEKHYITTIDVQKAISLDVNQNEAGSIHFAQNFPFDKIKPFSQIQNQPTPQPLFSAQIAVTPESFAPELSLNYLSTPQKSYVSNPATTAPGLFEVVPNQNLAVLQGLNDLTSSQYNPAFQERVGTNKFEYENQLVVPPPPVDLTNQPNDASTQREEDLKQVQENIQALKQRILDNIDAQHEEEQRKQNLVDQERKLYFQNLQKVEALKSQNTLSYRFPVQPQPDIIQATVSPVSSAESVSNVELVPQTQYVSTPQLAYNSPSQTQFDQSQETQYEGTQRNQYSQPQQTQYESAGQTQYDRPPQTVFDSPPQTYKTEIKDFKHEVAVPEANIQPIANLDVYQKPPLSYDSREIQTSNGARQYGLYETQNLYAVDNNLQQSAPEYSTEKVGISSYAPQVASVAQVPGIAAVAPVAQAAPVSPVAFQPRYTVPQVTKAPEKPRQTAVVNGQLVDLSTKVLSQTARVPSGKTLVLNNLVPFDYSRFLQVQQPLNLLQTYPVSLQAESKIVPGIYAAPEQVAVPIQISQAYKLAYPGLTDLGVSDKQYLSTLIQRPTNKLRVQPLKPSTPDEGGQREAVQNLLSQPQFHRTFYYPGFPINNRLQLRHIRKNQISNSDQVRSQSVRRGKSLKNLRIEYGFKPPLRPSVEFSEEVLPSIYGSSVQPQ